MCMIRRLFQGEASQTEGDDDLTLGRDKRLLFYDLLASVLIFFDLFLQF